MKMPAGGAHNEYLAGLDLQEIYGDKKGGEMKISFDLDGVIANTDKWFFRMLDVLRWVDGCNKVLLEVMEMDYYASRPLKYHPKEFMATGDTGFVLTSRRPKATHVTSCWLEKHGIKLPLIFSDPDSEIDWTDYEKASLLAGKYKANVISQCGVQVHFDNNPYIIQQIRRLQPTVRAVLIGGEELSE